MDHNTKCALAHPAPGTNTLPQIDISGHNQNGNCPQIIKSSRAVTKVLLILLGNAAFCKAFLEKSLFFIFRFACVQKKNVPRHILAPSAVACNNLHLRASAHLRGCRISKYFLLGGSPALCPNGIEIGHVFDAILYKRSSFPGIPFGMPYFRLFCFQLSKSMPFLMEKDNFPFFRSESCNEAY